MKKIITFIKSDTLLFVAILCVLTAQVQITMSVYQRINSDSAPLFALFYAIAIELAVLIFVINGQKRTSLLYGIGALLTDLFYFFDWPSWVGVIVVCSLLTGTIVGFTHLFTHRLNKELRKTEAQEAYEAAHPYACGECDSRFATPQQLNGHASAHKRVNKINA